MKTPREKFMNDPHFHRLVCILESEIEQGNFTPSEMREACVLASINYEIRHIRQATIDPRLEDAMKTLDAFIERDTSPRRRP